LWKIIMKITKITNFLGIAALVVGVFFLVSANSGCGGGGGTPLTLAQPTPVPESVASVIKLVDGRAQVPSELHKPFNTEFVIPILNFAKAHRVPASQSLQLNTRIQLSLVASDQALTVWNRTKNDDVASLDKNEMAIYADAQTKAEDLLNYVDNNPNEATPEWRTFVASLSGTYTRGWGTSRYCCQIQGSDGTPACTTVRAWSRFLAWTQCHTAVFIRGNGALITVSKGGCPDTCPSR
jgi:hypothetical protein